MEFDKILNKALEEADRIPVGQYTDTKELVDYERFKAVTHKSLHFSKYILMRIDR